MLELADIAPPPPFKRNAIDASESAMIRRRINVPNATPNVQGLATVNPIFTWGRLAQGVPVRIRIKTVPEGVRLILE